MANAFQEPGKGGFQVCKFMLVGIPGESSWWEPIVSLAGGPCVWLGGLLSLAGRAWPVCRPG